jgi:hypothetical protein
MTAQSLLRDLTALRVTLSAVGDGLAVDGPDQALTDDLLATIRHHKSDLLALLNGAGAVETSAPTSGRIEPKMGAGCAEDDEGSAQRSGIDTRPRLGSFARPMPVRGVQMPMDCLWDTCDGTLKEQGRGLYHCGKCETWFELLPPEDRGVYVGDLANDKAEVIECPASETQIEAAPVSPDLAELPPHLNQFGENVEMHDSTVFDLPPVVITFYTGEQIEIPQQLTPAGWVCPF